MRAATTIVLASLSVCAHLLANPIRGSEEYDTEVKNTNKTNHTTETPLEPTKLPEIRHACDTVPRADVGVGPCLYYCDYVEHNDTWLYGYYPDGLPCWAEDRSDAKPAGVPGICFEGICYPHDHDNMTLFYNSSREED
ncbi:uncharacterized protein LOC119399744 isoform X1 [Rhipicephalus sanguineus]|uniref:uncharacterized protein LOC119399673 n=1 Tax=Rhipicephalus sanguineus TaxID=34632 RepID=UPI001894A9F1|nr:uncharacterized protein LOC119399673 [Rhipicephalus sanguineus]XP_037522503.1 uncharacterized protein LOC119399744 isoform X1 [Rhipicephalus sanguineus]